MTIRRRFIVLLAMFGIAVLLSIASALWSFSMIEREVSRPYQSMATVMRSLRTIKRATEGQATLLMGPPTWTASHPEIASQGVRGERLAGEQPFDPERFDAASEEINREFVLLEAQAGWRLRAGQYAGANLQERVLQAHALALRWFEHKDHAARQSAGLALFNIHELIELIEGRILDDTQLAGVFEIRLRRQLIILLGMVAGLALLVGLLSLALLGRWIVMPVGRLRVAAERIGEGEFSYRLEPKGHDELALLGREVDQMAGLVERMQDERIESERLVAVGQMMRRLAHNIRNPLAGIRGLAELTRAEVEDEDHKESQRRIIDSVDRFDEWLTGLLRATSPAEIHVQETEISSWLIGVVEAHESMAAARGVAIDVDIDHVRTLGTRMFDPIHLGHALSAVLANAIEATPEGGLVGIEVASNAGDWSISIVDQGPGIPPDIMPDIFRPTFTTKKQGTGIGLASALHAVRGHGGRVEADNLSSPIPIAPESTRGTGARFTLVLPDQNMTDSMANNGHSGASSGQDSHH